jgi:hypothetical protein
MYLSQKEMKQVGKSGEREESSGRKKLSMPVQEDVRFVISSKRKS